MKARHMLGAALAVALLAGGAFAEGTLKSGPQPGSRKIPAFNPLHCNGPQEDAKACLVWKNGGNPVAMIFAREISDSLTSLVKKIDEATEKNRKARMGSFVVFCNDDEKLPAKLKELAGKEKLKQCVLSVVDRKAGPSGYDLNKDADITVVLYVSRTVKANHAFKKGEMKDKDIDKIVEDLSKILPAKK